MTNKKIIIIGGGTGGITLAARLLNANSSLNIKIIEPSEYHYYQPLWTLNGAGVGKKEDTRKLTKNVIPKGALWVQDKVKKINPKNNTVDLESGQSLEYDLLVISPGVQMNWEKIKGLKEGMGKNGICSNYSYKTLDYTYKFLKELKSGNALFTFPNTPIRCGGAPQKIMYLVEEFLRKHGRRENVNVEFTSAGGAIFGVEKYKKSLEKIISERNISTHFKINLEKVDHKEQVATFRDLESGEIIEKKFSFIHVVPPMSAPSFLEDSDLLDKTGWLDVDKHTFQHAKYKNIFGIGDVTNIPTAKTGAAIRKQAPVVCDNILKFLNDRDDFNQSYNGYSSCPLVTGYSSLILAEFDYDSRPTETFPFDQSVPRYSMFFLKAHILPLMYWHGMLKGRA